MVREKYITHLGLGQWCRFIVCPNSCTASLKILSKYTDSEAMIPEKSCFKLKREITATLLSGSASPKTKLKVGTYRSSSVIPKILSLSSDFKSSSLLKITVE